MFEVQAMLRRRDATHSKDARNRVEELLLKPVRLKGL